MSDKHYSSGVGTIEILFIVLKATGHWYLSTWSWWWVLLPIVPVSGWLLTKC